jgi:hypothetical protein
MILDEQINERKSNNWIIFLYIIINV